MSAHLRVKNWKKFQHYKHRNPPWIRLYCDLDRDEDFMELTDTQKWWLVACWQDASKDKTMTGLISANEKLFKRRWDINSKTSVFEPLIERGFLVRVHDDSDTLADCGQDARPETETERETEVCSEAETAPPSEPAAILTFDCIDKPNTWNLTQERLDGWEETFGARMDVLYEIRSAREWVVAHPGKRKTARGMPAFLVRWLRKTADGGGGNGRNSEPTPTDKPPEIPLFWPERGMMEGIDEPEGEVAERYERNVKALAEYEAKWGVKWEGKL